MSFGRVSKAEVLQNVMAGLTVSFVALSLGAAFGVLSGRGAFAGMLSAAIIATITSALGGTRIQCSGPTGVMTTVTVVLVAAARERAELAGSETSADHLINLTIFVAAAMLLLSAILRLGKFVALVPNVVISGFMNGIAVIICLEQLKKLFGFAGHIAYTGPMRDNLLIAAASFALAYAIPRFTRRYVPKFSSLLSGTFLTIILMTALSGALQLPVEHVQVSTTIHNAGDLTRLIADQWPRGWDRDDLLFVLPFAFQLFLIAYLDTLMTALVVDKMMKETTKPNKELMAQGVATVAVGVLGGIPGALATIRCGLMVKEGASLRLAGILVGVFTLIEIMLFQNAINLIPQAVFSGILIKVGVDVFDWLPVRLYVKELIDDPGNVLRNFLSRHDDEPIFVTNREMIMITATAAITVIWDLNIAVAACTAGFYLHNLVLNRRNPMRDLKPLVESESLAGEP